MNVYFIGNIYDGCHYVRCLLPQQANNWDGDRRSILSAKKTDKQIAIEASQSDVIVFHRPDELIRLRVAKMLQSAGKKVVFDNDDTYRDIKVMDKRMTERIEERSFANDEFIKNADLVTTTTETLAKEYRKLNKNVVVLPNCVDVDDWEEPKYNNTDKVRIGIVGSVTTTGDCEVIDDILSELSNRLDIQLVMFGLPTKGNKISELYNKEYKYWDKFNIEWQPFVKIYEYPKTLCNLRLDMVLIPRKDNYFNRCKSNIKFLEMSMCGIPVIAQGFSDGGSPYQGVDSEYMLIAENNNQWREHINKLIKDKSLRRKLGDRARRYVIDKYNIINNSHLWANEYKKIWNS